MSTSPVLINSLIGLFGKVHGGSFTEAQVQIVLLRGDQPRTWATNIAWWLRLKGVRDIGSGLAVLAFMMWTRAQRGRHHTALKAIIPVGDMVLILAAKGSTKSAFGIRGLTAVLRSWRPCLG